jgi:predicted transcriptional regulator
MGNRSALDLIGPTERQILHILWRDGPSSVSHLQAQLGGAPYTTVASPLQSLQRKGFVMKTGTHMALRYHVLPKQALLVLVCERHIAELEATMAERAHVA